MRKVKEVEGRRRPECQSERNQTNYGKNRSGTQRCKCNECGHTYTLNPKNRAYPDEVRNQAIKTYYSGGYLDVIYPGRHVRNMRNKSDTFTVEGGMPTCGTTSRFLRGAAGVLRVHWKHCKL